MSFSELSWVNYLKKHSKYIGDDCAIIKNGSYYALVGGDLFIENIHFKLDKISFKNIGIRAVCRSISDIAACSGIPKFIGISMGVPGYVNSADLKEISKGVFFVCKKYGLSLIGGDTSRCDKLFLDVWAIGESKKPVLRSGAKEGDYIFVSGRLGRLPFNKPFEPKIKEASFISKNFRVNSMMDISDGFIIDLYRILKMSKKGALVYEDRLPLTKGIDDLYRGEDYELLFTISKNEKNIKLLEKKYFCVGQIKHSSFGYKMNNGKSNKKINVKGYTHF